MAKNEYTVRTLLGLYDVSSPQQATDMYRERLETIPFDNWIHEIRNEDTKETHYAYKGNLLTLEELREVFDTPVDEADEDGEGG